MSRASADATWMDDAAQGVVRETGEGEDVLVALADGSRQVARRGRPMRERGIELRAGDAVLLARADDGSWQVARRFRFEAGREAPLLIPSVDPTVEYLLRPSAPPVPGAQITAGTTWRFQGWFRDGGTNPQWGFTNALKLVFTP